LPRKLVLLRFVLVFLLSLSFFLYVRAPISVVCEIKDGIH
jgi:hypothetical protein